MIKEFLRTEKIIINKTKDLVEWMKDSTVIYNISLGILRKEYFDCIKNGIKIKTSTYNQLYKIVSKNNYFIQSTLDYLIKEECVKQAINNWKSYIKAIISYNKNYKKFKTKPKLPKFLNENKLNILTIDKTRLRKTKHKNKINCNIIKLPKSNVEIQLSKLYEIKDIKCVKIINYYKNKLQVCICYKKEKDVEQINNNNCIGIDLGVSNLLAITANNQNLSWIVKGGIIKSINQYSNKLLSKCYNKLWKCNNKSFSKHMQQIRAKRDRKINHYFHSISKNVIKICLLYNISTIIIGNNKDWKQNNKFRKNIKQNFLYIPYEKLIQMIQYKAEENGIKFIITEESYTSKIDHLAFETLEQQDIYLGKRIKRGLYKSSTGKILNADINGAIGILRKEKVISNAELLGLRNRGDIVSPVMLPIGTYKGKY